MILSRLFPGRSQDVRKCGDRLMSVDEELRVEDVRWDGGDTHVHRHLEV